MSRVWPGWEDGEPTVREIDCSAFRAPRMYTKRDKWELIVDNLAKAWHETLVLLTYLQEDHPMLKWLPRLAVLAVVLWPVLVLAQAASLPSVDGSAALSGFASALHSNAYTLAFANGIMLLVYLLGKFNVLAFLKVSDKVLPWVVASVGALSAFAGALILHQPILEAIMAGFQAGVEAVGAHELVGQHVGLAAKTA